MKKIAMIGLLAIILSGTGCDRATSSINAANEKTLFRSVSGIKEFLSPAKRLKFEVGFWSLKEWSESDQAFRELIHRKDADEVIALAKEQFDTRKSSGDPNLAKYESWDKMIEAIIGDRESFVR